MAEAKHAQVLNSREHPPSIQINNGNLKNIKSETIGTTDPAKTNGLLPAPAHSRTGSSDSGEGLLLSASDLQARSGGGCSKSINSFDGCDKATGNGSSRTQGKVYDVYDGNVE